MSALTAADLETIFLNAYRLKERNALRLGHVGTLKQRWLGVMKVELDSDESNPINQIFGRTLQGLLRLLLVFVASLIVLIARDSRREIRAEPQTARIVGLGATACLQFDEDIRLNPSVQRDYLAWGQGYMSGILMGRPPGVDQGLDLNPPTFDMINQLHFLRDYCAENTSANFADAVEALYKRLRREGKT
ncbi:MAG: hypothetical protein WCA28_11680 [Bradyrhizobium sp.]